MLKKNRKIKKEELALWKKVTENDKVIGKYTTSFEENRMQQEKTVTSNVNKDNLAVKEIKSNFFKQDLQINKRMKLKLKRGLIRPELKLDLHGKTLTEAKNRLQSL